MYRRRRYYQPNLVHIQNSNEHINLKCYINMKIRKFIYDKDTDYYYLELDKDIYDLFLNVESKRMESYPYKFKYNHTYNSSLFNDKYLRCKLSENASYYLKKFLFKDVICYFYAIKFIKEYDEDTYYYSCLFNIYSIIYNSNIQENLDNQEIVVDI